MDIFKTNLLFVGIIQIGLPDDLTLFIYLRYLTSFVTTTCQTALRQKKDQKDGLLGMRDFNVTFAQVSASTNPEVNGSANSHPFRLVDSQTMTIRQWEQWRN